MLEESLRQAFAEQVAGTVGMADPAGRAIRHARHVRRLQVAGGGLAAACAIALVLLVAFAGAAPPRSNTPTIAGDGAPNGVAPPADAPRAEISSQVPVTPAPRLPVDVVDRALHTVQGKVLTLPFDNPPKQAVRVPDGWLAVEYLGRGSSRLWFVAPVVKESRILVPAAAAIAIASDGARVAWTVGTTLTVGRRLSAALAGTQSTTVPELVRPVGFVGPGVLLARFAASGGGTDGYDMWFPDRGAYKETVGGYSVILGGRPDGEELFALAPAHDDPERLCLVRVRALTMSPVRTVCDLFSTEVTLSWVSPDGRWLVLPQDRTVVGFDLTTVFDRPRPAATWNLTEVGRDAAWTDNDTLVVRVGKQLRVLSLTDPGHDETYPLSPEQMIVGQ